MVFCRSQSGEKSRPCSCSLSPCLKNSSMHLSSTSTLEYKNHHHDFFQTTKHKRFHHCAPCGPLAVQLPPLCRVGDVARVKKHWEDSLFVQAGEHMNMILSMYFTIFQFSINEDDYMVMSHLPLSTLEAATRFFIDFNWEKCIDMSERKFLYLPEMSINPSPSPTIYINQYINCTTITPKIKRGQSSLKSALYFSDVMTSFLFVASTTLKTLEISL